MQIHLQDMQMQVDDNTNISRFNFKQQNSLGVTDLL